MQTCLANVRTTAGGFIRVTIQAPNPFLVTEMLKTMYGARLIRTSRRSLLDQSLR